jgi:hypothetical protein
LRPTEKPSSAPAAGALVPRMAASASGLAAERGQVMGPLECQCQPRQVVS